MDIGRAFTYPFEDQDWLKKIAIGGVTMLVLPFIPVLAAGYVISHLRNLLEGRELPLPEWDDFAGYFQKGVAPVVALIAYLYIPSGLLNLLGSVADSGGISLVFCCLNVLYGIVFWLAFPAMVLRYAQTNDYSAFYAFSDVIAFIRARLRDYIIAVALMFAASVAASVIGGIACLVGMIFTGFIFLLISAHLLAQVASADEMPSV